MGGMGSTRWHRHDKKATVEDCLKLDIRQLTIRDSGEIVWTNLRTGEPSFVVQYKRTDQGIALNYIVIERDGQGLRFRYTLSLQQTACNYGGHRNWFSCPNCETRVGCLYLPPNSDYFLCRHCHELTYRDAQKAHQRPLILEHAGRAGKLKLKLLNIRPGTKRWRKIKERYDQLSLPYPESQ